MKLTPPKRRLGPKFSFVIPVFNRTRVVHEAIRSCLNQTFDDFEVIIVLDGSPVETRNVVYSFKDPRIRVFEYAVSSGTACRGRNRAILEAHGEYVAFLDSDDLSGVDRLERMVALLKATDADVVYGAVKFLPEVYRIDGIKFGDIGRPNPKGFSLADLIASNQIYTLTACVRRLCLLEYGGFRVELKYREDYELWLRLKHRGCSFASCQDVVSVYRIHGDNNELNFKDEDKKYYEQSLSFYTTSFDNWGV